MSAPFRQFENLSIDSMPETRGQAQAAAARRIAAPYISSDQEEEEGLLSPRRRRHPPTSNTAYSPADPAISDIGIRADNTRDILSTFHSSELPDEILRDAYSHAKNVKSPVQCVTQDLEETIFQLAVNDFAVYSSLNRAKPAKPRAIIYFQKILQHIKQTVEAFDDYTRQGELIGDLPDDPSVAPFGDQLIDLVERVRDGVRERQPYGQEQSAECLITLLRLVWQRNRDAFAQSRPKRPAPAGKRAVNRNLFLYIIDPGANGSDSFVLETLSRLEPETYANAKNRALLKEISDYFRQVGAPLSYSRKIQDILYYVDDLTGPEAGPASGHKRPAPGNGRGGKKRTK